MCDGYRRSRSRPSSVDTASARSLSLAVPPPSGLPVSVEVQITNSAACPVHIASSPARPCFVSDTLRDVSCETCAATRAPIWFSDAQICLPDFTACHEHSRRFCRLHFYLFTRSGCCCCCRWWCRPLGKPSAFDGSSAVGAMRSMMDRPMAKVSGSYVYVCDSV